MDLLKACQKFISIDSSPQQGTAEIVLYAKELCEQIGLHVDIEEKIIDEKKYASLIARTTSATLPTSSTKELLLQTHLDTHDPGTYGLWDRTERNPFQATIFNKKLYGLGASDTKLDFLCKLKAIENVLSDKQNDIKNIKKPFVLCGTYGLEKGLREIVRLVRKKVVLPDQAFIGAATNSHICDGAKGTVTVEIKIPFSEQEKNFRAEHNAEEGASSHSRMFMGDSNNAILKMLRYLAQLPDGIALLQMEGGINKDTQPSYSSLEFDCTRVIQDSVAQKFRSILWDIELIEKDFENYKDPNKNINAELNIGIVRTNDDGISLTGICHIPSNIKESIYSGWIEHLRQSCEKEGASFRIIEFTRPFLNSPDSSFAAQSAQELNTIKKNKTDLTACEESSEANIFSRLGVECLLFGPGQKKESFNNFNESVLITDLHNSVLFYEKIIIRLCFQ